MSRQKVVIRISVGILLLLIISITLGSALGIPAQLPPACQELAFSTEEDFVTRGPEPPDGNPVISDGDLLGPMHVVCARNADLLETFDVPHDLGLDAADVIDVDLYLVAFSTELDSSNLGQFTQGDLLITNGTIIPNQVLTHHWNNDQGVSYDIGLDAVQFVGDPANIIAFLESAAAAQQPISPGVMAELLGSIPDVDIWFSTEGTFGPVSAPAILNGDLLSVRHGTIVTSNDILLPASVPAGIPARGVDFGLDAVAANRFTDISQVETSSLHFSTEILYKGKPSFTDGDVLNIGNGISVPHMEMIESFEPYTEFLGLDALHMNLEPPAEGEINGLKFHDEDADGVLDTGEMGLERWVIHLDGNGVSEQTLTNASGFYSFTVPEGTYTLSEECPAGWGQSFPDPLQGYCGSGTHNVDLLAGQPLLDVNFGNYEIYSIHLPMVLKDYP